MLMASPLAWSLWERSSWSCLPGVVGGGELVVASVPQTCCFFHQALVTFPKCLFVLFFKKLYGLRTIVRDFKWLLKKFSPVMVISP